jgi:hypothetical protein
MLNFNKNQVTITIFIAITLPFILFMSNYLSFSCVFFILALFKPPGSGSAFGMRPIESGSKWIQIRNTSAPTTFLSITMSREIINEILAEQCSGSETVCRIRIPFSTEVWIRIRILLD